MHMSLISSCCIVLMYVSQVTSRLVWWRKKVNWRWKLSELEDLCKSQDQNPSLVRAWPTFIHQRATNLEILNLETSKMNSLHNIIIWCTLCMHCYPIHTLSQSLPCALSYHEWPAVTSEVHHIDEVPCSPLMACFIRLSLPSAPYVKVYLLNNGAYVAKKKTKIARKTLDPLYQQALLFEESPQGKVLQVRRYISS